MIGRRGVLGGAALLAAAPVRAQQYFPQGIFERTLNFTSADGTVLAGTLTLPWVTETRRVPGVVLIAGSGPTDRDGNNPLIPARVDLLKEIAHLLGRAGIGTLRYDKRGLGQSTPRPESLDEQKRFFTWDKLAGDVEAAHAELLRHDEIKSYATALLGHSEGGLLALAATVAMGPKRPYGLVLASTPGRPLGQIVREQIRRNAPGLAASANHIMDAIRETGEVPAGGPPAIHAIFPDYAGTFLRSAFAFDPAQALGETDAPCLLLQGAADSQVVAMEDIQPLVDMLGKRRGSGEAFVVPEVSHNLKRITGPGDPGFTGPVAPAIATRLTSWLGRLLGA